MKARILGLILALSLLLTGCSWMDGQYVHVTPHREKDDTARFDSVSVSNYKQLRKVLEDMVNDGSPGGVIFVSNYERTEVTSGMYSATRYITSDYPVGAYAVETLDYEIGKSSGKPAIAVEITYRHTPMEIRQIRRVKDMKQMDTVLAQTLKDVEPSLVMLVGQYEPRDFVQLVHDFAQKHPEYVMEIPQVTAGIYGAGDARVVDLKFTYQTSREALRQMQEQVSPVFEAAKLYVSADPSDYQKFTHLYSFLMERFDYRVETSITPSYSLLHHGVGDSRAIAVTYAAMCRNSGLECLIVTGTREGQPWTWNMVHLGEGYYHVDLLRCTEANTYQLKSDGEMGGYVWDYSAYPVSNPGELEENTGDVIPAVTLAPSGQREIPQETQG